MKTTAAGQAYHAVGGDMADRDEAEYWRERAQEARAQSLARRDLEGKRALLHIAENYEQLAEEAVGRDKARGALIEP